MTKDLDSILQNLEVSKNYSKERGCENNIEINYKILCIIKKYINFGNYFFSFKQTFSNPNFSTIQSKTSRDVSKNLIKLNKTIIKIKKKGKNRTYIKVKLILLNM